MEEEQRVTDQGSPVPNAKSTMVSALLETVDTELRRSRTEKEHMEQFSSPSPKKRSQKRTPDVQSNDTTSREDLAEETTTAQTAVRAVDGFSDYGDDDFDDDTLMALDATISLAVEKMVPAGDSKPKPGHIPTPAPAPAVSNSVTAVEEDFGDFDDDFFDGAEELLAQVETKQPSQHVQQEIITQPAQNSALLQQDELDEFGDDFGDDFDPDAAELAATQHNSTTFPPSSHVRMFP